LREVLGLRQIGGVRTLLTHPRDDLVRLARRTEGRRHRLGEAHRGHRVDAAARPLQQLAGRLLGRGLGTEARGLLGGFRGEFRPTAGEE
jgi:hypothetical protein